MDLRAGLDDVEKRKLFTLPGLELLPLVVQPIASRYIDYAIPAPPISLRSILILSTHLRLGLPSGNHPAVLRYMILASESIVKETNRNCRRTYPMMMKNGMPKSF
jgi:hypothetical protein